MKPFANLLRTLLLCGAALVAACGGGGSTSPSTLPDTGASAGHNARPLAANSLRLVVEPGPGNNVNIPYVSVTVCEPQGARCLTIDKVLVDTGSTGLRLFADAVAALNLPSHTTSSARPIYECAQFVHFVTWGPVRRADVVLGGLTAANVPVQLVADPAHPEVPLSCERGSSATRTPAELGANGILGVGLWAADGQLYYDCDPAGRWHGCPIDLPAAQQVPNPVTRLDTDNNGVVLQLPALGGSGAAQAEGLLVLGVGTRANNALGAAHVIRPDAYGFFETRYQGQSFVYSFLDSGSNALFFDDPRLPACVNAHPGFYCPATTQALTAEIALANGQWATVPFTVANAASILDTPSWAYANLGGPLPGDSFGWGLPFFFGRSVYTVVEGYSSPAGKGPLLAFTD